MIHAQALSKAYAGPNGTTIAALGPVDLAIAPGEFVCIVGPSGCGKSTLLRLLAGLEPPASGTLQVGARAKAGGDRPPSLVFQGDSTFPWFTVHENIEYGLRMQGAPGKEREAVVAQMIKLVGLTAFAEAYPYQLSGGMKQRVAIARALANNTDVLLMDEPFGALDEQTRLVLQNELLRLWDQTRKTVLFVTHSIDEAIVLGDRVLVMSRAPGTFTAEFRVPFARPREAVSLKREPAFGELQYEIWRALGQVSV